VAAPLARLTVPQLKLIAALVRPGEVARLAAAGRIVLPLTGPAGAVLPRLAGAGLLVADDHPLSGVTACSGTACASSLADVRSLAAPVPGLAAVHWAGCSRRCGLPADATAVVASSASQFTVADGAVSDGTVSDGTVSDGMGAGGTARRVLTVVPG
jgi:precorrin-3B synthase